MWGWVMRRGREGSPERVLIAFSYPVAMILLSFNDDVRT